LAVKRPGSYSQLYRVLLGRANRRWSVVRYGLPLGPQKQELYYDSSHCCSHSPASGDADSVTAPRASILDDRPKERGFPHTRKRWLRRPSADCAMFPSASVIQRPTIVKNFLELPKKRRKHLTNVHVFWYTIFCRIITNHSVYPLRIRSCRRRAGKGLRCRCPYK
jgi:hypothetical protein